MKKGFQTKRASSVVARVSKQSPSEGNNGAPPPSQASSSKMLVGIVQSLDTIAEIHG